MNAGTVLDLPAARLAVAGRDVALRLAEHAEEPLPDRHRDLVLLLLQPVRAGDAAAVRVELDRVQLRDESEQVERGLADPVALLLAGCVVGDGHRQRPEVSAHLAALIARTSSSSTSRISRASRFSISPQLVELETIAQPSRA